MTNKPHSDKLYQINLGNSNISMVSNKTYEKALNGLISILNIFYILLCKKYLYHYACSIKEHFLKKLKECFLVNHIITVGYEQMTILKLP